MYKSVFQNSRSALAFAGMTIIGAVMMVGSPEDGGVLDKAVKRLSDTPEAVAGDEREFAEAPREDKQNAEPGAGWGGSPSVFDENHPDEPSPENGSRTVPEPARASPRPPQALVPGRLPVIADNVGIPVPGPDDLPGGADPQEPEQ